MKNREYSFDEEESEILDAFDKGELDISDNSEEIKEALFQASENIIKKKKKITIRVSEYDLTKLKLRSLETGVPYQTTLNALIHQYVRGDISLHI